MLKKIIKGLGILTLYALVVVGFIALFISAVVQQQERSSAQLARIEARYE